MVEERLRQELEASFRNRADLYRLMHAELTAELGLERGDQGRMYPTDVTRHADGIDFRVRRCPLKDAWREAGLDDTATATLCRVAGAFDKGLFEAAGVQFANQTWSALRGGGCCHIMLRDTVAAA